MILDIEIMMIDNFGKALREHLAHLPADQLQKIRGNVEKAAAKSAADKRGKAAFIALLDEIERENESKA